MSLWLKRRVVMWCAVAMLLGGGWWFSSVRAQNEVSPPAKTPEAAAANFMALLTNRTGDSGPYGSFINPYAPFASLTQLGQTISRVQRQKMEKHDPIMFQGSIMTLLLEMASVLHQQEYKGEYKGKVVDQSEDKAVVELQRAEPPVSPFIVCVVEDGGWRVDLLGTYAKWKGLSERERGTLVAELTGAVSPLPAANPEVMNVINRAHENARRASCQSNLKQVSLGIAQYMQDYDEKLPPAREWAEVIEPYVRSRQVFQCPSVPDKNGYGYAYNSRLSHKDYNVIPETSQMAWVYETADLRWNAYGMGEKPAFRHLGGANYAFADGHVKWIAKRLTPQFTFRR